MNRPFQITIILSLLLGMISCGSNDDKPVKNWPEPRERQDISKFKEVPLTLLPYVDKRGDDTFTTDEKYPYSISLDLDTFAGKVAVFGAAYQLWLGPKGWSGRAETVPEGTIHVWLHPAADSSGTGSGITYTEMPSCRGCIVAAAAPFFAEAKKTYNKAGNENPALKAPVGLTIEQVSPSLVIYRLPERSGLQTIGVAQYLAQDSVNDAYFLEAKFTMPAEQKALAEFFVKKFVEMRELH
ncbi:MAG: hypothetical protein K0Q79_774 [Flavipsychrobacter sp.]|jgi:hypothetical protein|nr:hypothetical protein [Flavipsychrobacter sp.]